MAADAPTKLPVAPNINQVLNRISLGLAKHERILKTLNRPSSTTSTANPKSKPSSSGFSSLSGSSTPTPNPANTPKALTRADEEAEFAAERALAPNAGIGFAPVKEDTNGVNGRGGAKEDKMLRGRILGKNAREQMNNKGKDKRRRYESESEEEEGRSGLGKKKKVAAVVKAEPVKGEDVTKGEAQVEQEKTDELKEKISDDNAVPEVKMEEPASMEVSVAAAAAATNSKNRKKKMRKAANKKAGKQQQDAENDTDMPDAPTAPTAPLTEEELERKRLAPDCAGEGAAEADGETAGATDLKAPDATDSNSASAVGEKKARRKRGKKAKASKGEEDGDVAMEE